MFHCSIISLKKDLRKCCSVYQTSDKDFHLDSESIVLIIHRFCICNSSTWKTLFVTPKLMSVALAVMNNNSAVAHVFNDNESEISIK